jgi:ArsR family transcriptional regulator
MRKVKEKINFNQERLDNSTDILRALAHPLRIKILSFIDQNDEINVNKIYNTLDLEQSITSQHLSVLRNADVVQTSKEGKFVQYSIDYIKVDRAVQAIKSFLQSED